MGRENPRMLLAKWSRGQLAKRFFVFAFEIFILFFPIAVAEVCDLGFAREGIRTCRLCRSSEIKNDQCPMTE